MSFKYKILYIVFFNRFLIFYLLKSFLRIMFWTSKDSFWDETYLYSLSPPSNETSSSCVYSHMCSAHCGGVLRKKTLYSRQLLKARSSSSSSSLHSLKNVHKPGWGIQKGCFLYKISPCMCFKWIHLFNQIKFDFTKHSFNFLHLSSIKQKNFIITEEV